MIELRPETPVWFEYTNHRGERSKRNAVLKFVRFGTSDWHKEPQWFAEMFDLIKGADRTFAIKDIRAIDDKILDLREKGKGW